MFDRCALRASVLASGATGGRAAGWSSSAAEQWNDLSRGWWRELNRVCKLRADRAVAKLGADYKGGLLLYQWELQSRGVWHLHFVVGLETAIERAWAIEYVKAMRELGPRYGFGFVDAKPLRSPLLRRPTVPGHISKYLVKRQADGSFEVSETVKAAGRTLLNFAEPPVDGAEPVHDADAPSDPRRVGVARGPYPLGAICGRSVRVPGRAVPARGKGLLRLGLRDGAAGGRRWPARAKRPPAACVTTRVAPVLHRPV